MSVSSGWTDRICKHPGCDRMKTAKGYCGTHYEQLRKRGTTTDIITHAQAGELGYAAKLRRDDERHT